ncbi:hypothetical protein WDA79_07620, partial [Streptomyces sp. A475]
VDLNETFRIPDPSPVTAADGKSRAGTGITPAAPGKNTSADHPYLPTGETGATDFTAAHPTWDAGRGPPSRRGRTSGPAGPTPRPW